jgi:haloalkane dehalogenase
MEPTETVLLGDAGTFVTEEDFVRLRGAMKNVKTVFLGLERHFVQEDYPHTIGKEIVDWVEESSL